MSLAQAFLKSGDLNQARLYAEDCLSADNFYWMLNYGIDPDQYKRDIHEILYKAYRGLGKKEALTSHYGLLETARGIVMRTVFYFKYRAHKLLFQKYSLLSAGAFETEQGGRHLEALFEYYNAFYDYKDRAVYYLQAAKDFELELIPESAASYLFETGKFLRNEAVLQDAVSALDPVWEKDIAADAYTELALTARDKKQPILAVEAAGRLFALNPGALRQNGIRLPIDVQVIGGGGLPARRTKSLIKALFSAGFDTRPAATPRWTLRLRIDGDEVYAELYDSGTGVVTRRKTLPLPSFQAKHLSMFANTLADDFTSK
jgi:tetratricopeptide (TPR) repeat protein